MTHGPTSTRLRGEQGAVLIQVAVALLAFTMLSAFVVDYGMALASRNQAQNAADAAALASATVLAFEDYANRTETGRAYQTAETVAATNLVSGAAAAVSIDPNWFCKKAPGEDLSVPPAQACVSVTTYRDAAHKNPIDNIFARLIGSNTFNTTATAIARAQAVNATKCLRPLAVPNKWEEKTPPWTPASTFDRWDSMNPGTLLDPSKQDFYYAPQTSEAGTGLQLPLDFGAKVTLTEGVLTSPIATIKPWQYLPIEIPDSKFGSGAAALRNNTNSCARGQVTTGDMIDLVPGAVHDNALAIIDGINDLLVKDPDAVWNPVTNRIENSCADRLVGHCAISPRVIAIALYDPTNFADDSHAGAGTSVWVNNIVGFFIECAGAACPGATSNTDIIGYITTHPGIQNVNAVTLYDDAAFLRAPMLVQ
jgi:Flp pilus assembly protein TadG